MNIRLMKIILIIFSVHEMNVSLQTFGIRKYVFNLPENFQCGFNRQIYAGKCKKISDCSKIFMKQRTIEICQFNNFNPSETLVCCSREDFIDSQSHVIVKKGPLDYENCIEKYIAYRAIGDESAISFTVNGVEVKQGEFSHAAALGWISWNDLSVNWHCGGSLITESFVLTAAHCTNVRGLPPQIVRIGDLDLESVNDDANVQQKSIINIIPHPNYDQITKLNDIALIQLASPIILTRFILPACIYEHENLPTEFFEVAGYGQNGEGEQTNKLLKVHLKYVPIAECQTYYEDLILEHKSQICAESYKSSTEIQDTCYGDSGSGVQFTTRNFTNDNEEQVLTPTLIGLVNFGIGCGSRVPGVYLKVSNYISWMENLISPDIQ